IRRSILIRDSEFSRQRRFAEHKSRIKIKTYSAAVLCFLRLSQLYLRWNFSTRPVVSRYFILPVKKGWHAEQISTVMFFLVLRVTNLLPQPQVTVASTYCGWIPDFMFILLAGRLAWHPKQSL